MDDEHSYQRLITGAALWATIQGVKCRICGAHGCICGSRACSMQRILIFLTASGSIALLIGAAMVLAIALETPESSTLPALNELPHPETLYVGSDTCFTCHAEQELIWEQNLFPLIIQDQMGDPQAILASEQPSEDAEDSRQSENDSSALLVTEARSEDDQEPELNRTKEAALHPNSHAKRTRRPLTLRLSAQWEESRRA